MFSKILIANRAEIASRVIRSSRKLGVKTVAICSPSDCYSPFALEADEVHVFESDKLSESYLDGNAIIQIAKSMGAEAIHPGYGFLSEDADFVSAVEDSGLVFVGPNSNSMRALGDKLSSRHYAEKCSVPLLPHLEIRLEDADIHIPDLVSKKFNSDLFPLLLKSTSAGGGRGMRIIHSTSELEKAVESVSKEAQRSFGGGSLIIEPYIERARHVEVQVLGDKHGQIHIFGTRDCSLQRKRQKLVEEALAPGLSKDIYRKIEENAEQLCVAAGLDNASTVEFLLTPNEAYYFLEVNTRLQVEHTVSETVFNTDLVELQLRAASGEKIPPPQKPGGHAIEVRICAEVPFSDYSPASGAVYDFYIPNLPGVRVDSGIKNSSEVGALYDSLLAKLIVSEKDRESCIQKLSQVLGKSSLSGIENNLGFLKLLVDSDEFRSLRHTTQTSEQLLRPLEPTLQECLACLLAHRSGFLDSGTAQTWRASPERLFTEEYSRAGMRFPLSLKRDGASAFQMSSADSEFDLNFECEQISSSGYLLKTGIGDTRIPIRIEELKALSFDIQHPAQNVVLTVQKSARKHKQAGSHGYEVESPLPGAILKTLKEKGDSVEKGEVLFILESMKMEHSISAPASGKLSAVEVQEGRQVSSGQILARIGQEK